ncbi:ABC transporter permease [Dulcicalothrix desertica]|nr:ABC transporter permease [Dulcicalothrix desertica]
MLQFIEKLGEWNPQFTREIKGRLKLFPILVTSAISLVVQAVVFLAQLGQIPGSAYRMTEKYCGIGRSYQQELSDISEILPKLQNSFFLYSSKENFDAIKLEQVKIQLEQATNRRITLEKVLYEQPCPPGQINMTEWWHEHFQYIFQALSVIFIITLLVAGTYLLINNLAQEERRGTLNFIRLSPQSEFSILTGKMLGVPILVYLSVTLAIPFHIFSGQAAGIAFNHILSYYAVLAGSCIFFFSAAFLFSLTTRALGGFQPWLGAGSVLMFLTFLLLSTLYGSYLRNGAAWFIMFSPVDATSYLFPNLFKTYDGIGWSKYKEIQFFYIPISTNLVSFLGIHLVNYGLWTYGIWQGLQRRFRNPNTPVISKQQSYFLVAFVQILLWGFTLQQYAENRGSTAVDNPYYNIDINSQILSNLPIFALFNFVLLFGLIFILSQERQTIQDWARYRHKGRRGWWHNSLLRDLLFGEKSPAILAFALHLLTMSIPFAIWIFLSKQLYTRKNVSIDWLFQDNSRLKFALGIALLAVLWAIGATVAQRMLLLKTSKRYLWACGTTSALLFAPALILSILNNTSDKRSFLWLFSIHPWEALPTTSLPIVFMALFTEVMVLGFLNIRMVKKIISLHRQDACATD